MKCLLYALTSVGLENFFFLIFFIFLSHKAVLTFNLSGKMEGNVECDNNETKVQLVISNTSLSSGNRNDLISAFFSQCTIYLKIDLSSTSLRDLLNSIFNRVTT